MVLSKLKILWDYCTYNKLFFLFILLLLLILDIIQIYSYEFNDEGIIFLFELIFMVLLSGYGMSITRDRINHGYRLPKIIVSDVIFLGIKSMIVILIYFFVQGFILDFICSPLDFPAFDLEDMILNWTGSISLLFQSDPLNAVIFIIVGGITFYITAFIAEIGLAKLADSRSILSAFNLVDILRSINIYGFRNYVKDYTKIVVLIVFFSYLENGITLQNFYLELLLNVFFGFFVFATQYMGIGGVYCVIKDKKKELETSE